MYLYYNEVCNGKRRVTEDYDLCLCMYVCMYVGMYVCMYMCLYVCMYVCMYVYMFICMYYVCMYVCIYMFICMYYVCIVYVNPCTDVELPPGGFRMTSVRNKSVDFWKLHNNFCTDFVKKGNNFSKRWLLLTKPGSGISSLN